MHPFYNRAKIALARTGSNLNDFSKTYNHPRSTIQYYWNSEKLWPGVILQDFSLFVQESLDYLIFGKGNPEEKVLSLEMKEALQIMENLNPSQQRDLLLMMKGAELILRRKSVT